MSIIIIKTILVAILIISNRKKIPEGYVPIHGLLAPSTTPAQAAIELLNMEGSSPRVVPDYQGALGIVRPASFNCYIYEASDADSFESRVSLLQQRYGGAVEVRTRNKHKKGCRDS
jgi:hypothetical protein